MAILPLTSDHERGFSVLGLSKKVMDASLKVCAVISSYIDVTKVLLITAIALSCIAFVGSLLLNSHLLVSVSLTLCSISVYAYKLYHDLNGSRNECNRLKDHIFDSERIKKENAAVQKEMRGSIDRLELVKLELETTNRDLQTKLSHTVELVELCEKVVTQAAGKAEASSVEVARQLESHKEVIQVWLKEIKRGLKEREKVLEAASTKVISILSEFSLGQHTELTRMLEQLRSLQQQIDSSKLLIAEQQETLKGISADIRSGAEELQAMHKKLSAMHAAHLFTERKGADVFIPLTAMEV